MPALDQVLGALGHVVTQVVEAELVVRAVGDVHGVLLAALGWALPGQDASGGQPQEAVDTAHQVGLVLSQVVVHRHHVDALAGQCTQVGGHGGDQGLALTGLHLSDVAQVQGRAAHDLDVVGAHTQHTVSRLAHGGEGLRQQGVQALAIGVTRLELVGRLPELSIGELTVGVRKRLDLVRDGVELLEGAPLSDAKDPVDKRHTGFSLW